MQKDDQLCKLTLNSCSCRPLVEMNSNVFEIRNFGKLSDLVLVRAFEIVDRGSWNPHSFSLQITKFSMMFEIPPYMKFALDSRARRGNSGTCMPVHVQVAKSRL